MKTFLGGTTFRVVLFDIDNTLYRDSRYVDHQIEVIIERLAEHREATLEQTRRLIQRTREELERRDGRRPSLGDTLVALGVPITLIVAWREELIDPGAFLTADPGVRSVLLQLAEHFRLLAVTNNPVATGRRTLEVLGVVDLFETIVGLDTCHQSKPSWGPFEKALEVIAAVPSETVVVGDRYDIDLEPMIVRGGGGILLEYDDDFDVLPEILGIDKPDTV